MTLTQISSRGVEDTLRWSLGASGTDHYTFTGPGLTGTVNDPTIYLSRGQTYIFENTSGGHPFQIQSVAGSGGSAYNTGVTNNGGGGGTEIKITVPHDAPDNLYYQCTSHANMGGTIFITGAVAAGSITTAKIADDAVDADKLANSINTAIAANTAKDLTALSASNLTSGTVPDARFPATLPSISGANLTNLPVDTSALQGDINDLTNSVALLGFKIAVNGSLTKYNLANQTIDEFNDASGIDASASTNEIRNSTNKYWVGASANYPTGGTITTYTAGTNNYRVHTFLSDSNFVAANTGTVDMLIVGGGGAGGNDIGGGGAGGEVFFLQNHSLSAATYGVSIGAGGTESGGSGTYGTQGTGSYFGSDYATTNLFARGGGGGAGQSGNYNATGNQLTTIAGTGNGGGGSVVPNNTAGTGYDANFRSITVSGTSYTLGGYNGGTGEKDSYYMGGGGASSAANGQSTTGKGAGGVQVDIDGNGYYWGGGGGGGAYQRAVWSWGGGGTGGGGAGTAYTGGGASGGGSALNAGASTTGAGVGGAGGTNTGGGGGGGSSGNNDGGSGGSGIVIVRYLVDQFQDNVDLTLQSVDATASTAPTKADLVLLYEDGVGTATLNTDIKGFISRDSGATFTQGTLVAEGSYTTSKKIVAFHDLDISGQPSGTSVCYKITTHNQGGSKQTRVHAVSHGWA